MRIPGIVALCVTLAGFAASRQEVAARLGDQFLGKNVDAGKLFSTQVSCLNNSLEQRYFGDLVHAGIRKLIASNKDADLAVMLQTADVAPTCANEEFATCTRLFVKGRAFPDAGETIIAPIAAASNLTFISAPLNN